MLSILNKLALYADLFLIASVVIRIAVTVLLYNDPESEDVPEEETEVKYFRVSLTDASRGAVVSQRCFFAINDRQARKKCERARKTAIEEAGDELVGEMSIKVETISQEDYRKAVGGC
jgi:hypothetical protein